MAGPSNTFRHIAVMLCVLASIGWAEVFLSNMTPECMRCLCHAATGCNFSLGCQDGYCGPFRMSRIYWVDSNKPTLPNDDPERNESFGDCAINYQCASSAVENYIEKYGKDCNGDGVTDCDDFVLIQFNGGYQCQHPLNRNEAGRNFLARYNNCRP